jgi:hypothetical protein
MSKINEDILRRKFSRQYALDLSHILSVDLIDSEYVHLCWKNIQAGYVEEPTTNSTR